MSEPEDDSFLLDEIKALEDVLAADDSSESSYLEKTVGKQHNLKSPSRRGNYSSRGFGEVTPYHEPEPLDEDETSGRPESALEQNRRLIELLQESKRELMSLLERCLENKTIVEERIKERAKNAKSTKILIGSAGMPYFKDAKQYVAPRNKDAVRKTLNGELQVVHLRYTSPWTARDRNILWRAIRQEASCAELEIGRQDAGVECSSRNEGTSVSRRWSLPKNFKAMVGPVGNREFDWMKIAAMDFDNRHTAEECRVMWRVFLHPDINRYRWTKEEDAGIARLSKKYNHQNWDTLAKELATNRSGYQCFIRYNTNNQSVCVKESAWSPEEDSRLLECVKKFQIGHYVPWGTVAKYMEGRSKIQVYFRWKYNAAPHLKKGRFTPEEDAKLLDAVKKHSTNFGKISTYVMPNRSSVQLSDHYLTLVQRERGIRNSWSVNDDARLVRLYKKYGADWSRIAEKFTGKTRTQLRHRHKSILRQWERGISLYEIPRSDERSSAKDRDEEMEILASMDRERVNEIHNKYCKEVMQVDLELINYFQVVPPAARPGRKQKYYRQEELEDVTRKLYINLRTLNANLTIPDELDDRSLTEKDKQLLISLRDYRQSQIEHAVSQYERLKNSRIIDDETDVNHLQIHFAPLCPGDCNKNERFRLNDAINYESPDDPNCQIKLNLVFDTPAIVVDSIGDETNADFELLMKIIKTRKVVASGPSGAVRKIYVLGPNICPKNVLTVAKNLPGISVNLENSQREDCASTREKKSRRAGRGKTWDSSVSEGIICQPNRTLDCVEPNYHTLLGLQHIISSEEDTAKSSAAANQPAVSGECKKSMEMLKRRLTQLFKYPIGLSHVLRPEIYAKKVPTIGIVEDQGIVEDSSNVSSPPTKRKRMARKKCANSK